MYRQIIIPESNSFLLNLPAYFVGRKVEIIAFQTDKEDIPESDLRKLVNERHDQKQRLEKLLQFIQKNPIRLPRNYRFNRDELYE
ncbi:MAG: hypothetical protein HY958_14725 [Bacteroidia bacterium]|nr:hypothetical protein [Bacteroidia bacterium]